MTPKTLKKKQLLKQIKMSGIFILRLKEFLSSNQENKFVLIKEFRQYMQKYFPIKIRFKSNSRTIDVSTLGELIKLAERNIYCTEIEIITLKRKNHDTRNIR